jgi:hypothetical protein
MAKKTKASVIIERMGHELKTNPPKILAHTAAKFGAADAERQRKAILLSKARKAGAHIALSDKMKRMKEKYKNA